MLSPASNTFTDLLFFFLPFVLCSERLPDRQSCASKSHLCHRSRLLLRQPVWPHPYANLSLPPPKEKKNTCVLNLNMSHSTNRTLLDTLYNCVVANYSWNVPSAENLAQ